MKFLALMKDSLREAIDAKVLYVTVGLSCLLDPGRRQRLLPPADGPGRDRGATASCSGGDKILVQAMSPSRRRTRSCSNRRFRADRPRTSRPEPLEPWEYNYQFDVFLTFDDPGQGQRLRQAAIRRFGRDRATMIDIIDKDSFTGSKTSTPCMIPPDKDHPLEVRYHITSARTTIEQRRSTGGYEPTVLFAVPLPAFAHCSLHGAVYWIEDYMVNGFGSWIGILVAVVLTAFFVPNMLRKGTVDMLLVKPIHRVDVLLYKYIGGLTFVFLNAVVGGGRRLADAGLAHRHLGAGLPGQHPRHHLLLRHPLRRLGAVGGADAQPRSCAILATLLVVGDACGARASAYSILDRTPQGAGGEGGGRHPAARCLYTAVDALHFVLPRDQGPGRAADQDHRQGTC